MEDIEQHSEEHSSKPSLPTRQAAISGAFQEPPTAGLPCHSSTVAVRRFEVGNPAEAIQSRSRNTRSQNGVVAPCSNDLPHSGWATRSTCMAKVGKKHPHQQRWSHGDVEALHDGRDHAIASSVEHSDLGLCCQRERIDLQWLAQMGATSLPDYTARAGANVTLTRPPQPSSSTAKTWRANHTSVRAWWERKQHPTVFACYYKALYNN
ncbi:hypothetical protein CSAL01_13574 [Colletotrichum salicis]|uniref:Uncharacterized protein n=1 Tax=Colletotrichum salicis TaxID=1209931 RepID=A0A135UG23_9PEZI|nr:hypothetical protein CSAL01_13574 [Colletotrichum salicis]